MCYSKERNLDLIEKKAKISLEKIHKIPIFKFNTPYNLEISCFNDHIANVLTLIPGVKRNSLLTISYRNDNYLEMFKVINAMMLLSIVACDN